MPVVDVDSPARKATYRTHRVSIAGTATTVVPGGMSYGFHLPIQGVVATGQLAVAFGFSTDEIPVTEGFFISAVELWDQITLHNLTAATTLTFVFVLTLNPEALIIPGN